jgi:large subunit ribosomal protein L25
MANIELSVERRKEIGKNVARRARAAGKVPAVVYGAKKETVPIYIEARALTTAFRKGAGDNAIYLLKMAGTEQSRHAMIKEINRDPVSRALLHVDFVRVLMDVKVRVPVALELVGVPKGVKQEGGILDFVSREVEIECLPTDIPARLPVDVSEVGMGESYRVGQIPAQPGLRILDDPDKVIAHVAHPAKEEEVAAAPVEAAATATEPEVIKKGKLEETPEEPAKKEPAKKEGKK